MRPKRFSRFTFTRNDKSLALESQSKDAKDQFFTFRHLFLRPNSNKYKQLDKQLNADVSEKVSTHFRINYNKFELSKTLLTASRYLRVSVIHLCLSLHLLEIKTFTNSHDSGHVP